MSGKMRLRCSRFVLNTDGRGEITGSIRDGGLKEIGAENPVS